MSTLKPETDLKSEPLQRLRVEQYTNGLIGPSQPMLGPLADGGTLVTGTPPGCWGPMITPAFEGGHEVTQPVAIAGAEIGDAVRVSGAKRDVLQDAIALVKKEITDFPLQYGNFRD